MTDLPARKVDLVEDSRTHLLTVAFPRTNSPVYALAVSIAAGAAKYEAAEMGKSLLHCAAFAKTRDDASRALTLMRYLIGWKGVQVFAGGKSLQRGYSAHEVLACYVASTACNDWRAHCLTIINDPRDSGGSRFEYTIRIDLPEPAPRAKPPARWMFPCKLLHPYMRFEAEHPASFADQIQAAAVSRGCDWCPRFDAGGFRRVEEVN